MRQLRRQVGFFGGFRVIKGDYSKIAKLVNDG